MRGALKAACFSLLLVAVSLSLHGLVYAQYQMDPDAGYIASGAQYDPEPEYQLEGVRIYSVVGDETQKVIGFMKIAVEHPVTEEITFFTYEEMDGAPEQMYVVGVELAILVPSSQAYPGSPVLSTFPENSAYQIAIDDPWSAGGTPPVCSCTCCTATASGCVCTWGCLKACYR